MRERCLNTRQLLVTIGFIGVGAGCGSAEGESDDNGAQRQVLVVQGENFASRIVEPSGRRWQFSKRAVLSDEAVASAKVPRTERSIQEMTVEEVAAAEQPIMEIGGAEYKLHPDDALELAHVLKKAAGVKEEQSEPHGMPESGNVRTPQRVFNGESRVSVWNNFWPWSMIGVMSGGCTVFKLINQFTAVTAAHCVHTGSGWKPRRAIQFAAPTGIVGQIEADCYDRQVPGGWDGESTDYDRAIIRLRSSTANCNFPDYDVGWFGYRTVGGCLTGLGGELSGYPTKTDSNGQQPPGNWTYPLLFTDWRSNGWTSCGTYPTQVWYTNDTTDGQSGGPWWAVFDGVNQVRAINKGHDTGVFSNTNRGRRMTSDLVSWLKSNAGY